RPPREPRPEGQTREPRADGERRSRGGRNRKRGTKPEGAADAPATGETPPASVAPTASAE
ncbi:hypothetical protein, partial [Hymenobacter lapidarius]|uniref:hypothetical protein n=1 Tax=Hymenobacter lapidarius TaxID=1908237 RepID=UPI0019561EF8